METEDLTYNDCSANQQQFVDDAEANGHEVEYDYSGRGMYGRECPAVRLGPGEMGFSTDASYNTDSMGLGSIVYAQC